LSNFPQDIMSWKQQWKLLSMLDEVNSLVNLCHRFRLIEEERETNNVEEAEVDRLASIEKFSKMPKNELLEIYRLFKSFDRDNSGGIDRTELMENLKYFGLSDSPQTKLNHLIKNQVSELMDACLRETNQKEVMNLEAFVTFCNYINSMDLKKKWKHYEQCKALIEIINKKLDEIWNNANKGQKNSDSLPWDSFLTSFCGVSGTQDEHLKQCLANVFGVDRGIITKTYFDYFKESFGPCFPHQYNQSHANESFLESIRDLYKTPYFFGYISGSQSEDILSKPNYAKKDVFLLRFSTNKGGKFCLSTKDKNQSKVNHTLVLHETYIMDGIKSYIETQVKSKKNSVLGEVKPYKF